MELTIGSKVKWETTAKHWRTGTIVFEVAGNESPNYSKLQGKQLREFLENTIYAGKHKSALSDGYSRGHKSYLVQVDIPGKKPAIYWPRVSALHNL